MLTIAMASSLTSSSTDAQVEAAYDDNASYAEDLSPTKAKAFVTAVRILLRRLASGMSKGSNSLNYDRGLLQKQLAEAQEWVLLYSADDRAGPRITRADFRSFR